jgi:hypothetical protein
VRRRTDGRRAEGYNPGLATLGSRCSTEHTLSKGQRGNKEQKKPKKAPAPAASPVLAGAPAVHASGAAKLGETLSVPPRRK